MGEQRPDFAGHNRAEFRPRSPRHRDHVQLSEAATAASAAGAPVDNDEATRKENPRTQLLVRLVERLTGKKLRLLDPSTLTEGNEEVQKRLQDIEKRRPGGAQQAGFGVAYDASESYYKAETTSCAAQGTVTTKDGQEITIDVNLILTVHHHCQAA